MIPSWIERDVVNTIYRNSHFLSPLLHADDDFRPFEKHLGLVSLL